MFATIVEAVRAHAGTISDKPAVIFRKTTLTYAGLYSLVEKAAAVLKAAYGIKAGDKVMITGLSRPEYLVVFLGIQYLHATTVPLDKVWREEAVLKLYDFRKRRSRRTNTRCRIWTASSRCCSRPAPPERPRARR